jgi:hypothetical protein
MDSTNRRKDQMSSMARRTVPSFGFVCSGASTGVSRAYTAEADGCKGGCGGQCLSGCKDECITVSK